MKETVAVRYERKTTNGWWSAKVNGELFASGPDAVACSPNLQVVRNRVRQDYYQGGYYADGAFDIEETYDYQLTEHEQAVLGEAVQLREEAAAAHEKAVAAIMRAARALCEKGLSCRDIGQLLGISRQRAHKILVSESSQSGGIEGGAGRHS